MKEALLKSRPVVTPAHVDRVGRDFLTGQIFNVDDGFGFDGEIFGISHFFYASVVGCSQVLPVRRFGLIGP